MKGPAEDYVRQLKEADGGDIGIHGSVRLADKLIAARLVDELRLIVPPTIAGRGNRVFTTDAEISSFSLECSADSEGRSSFTTVLHQHEVAIVTELAPDPELIPTADEAATLWSFLDYYRSILIRKVEGITEAQARITLGPSDLTLIGLVRHMAQVERNWFRRRFMDIECDRLYRTDASGEEDPDAEFHGATPTWSTTRCVICSRRSTSPPPRPPACRWTPSRRRFRIGSGYLVGSRHCDSSWFT